MSDVLRQSLRNPDTEAYYRGYLASNLGFPHGELSRYLLNKAAGTTNGVVMDTMVPMMLVPASRPDLTAEESTQESIKAYGLKGIEDVHEFIEGVEAAEADARQGVRL